MPVYFDDTQRSLEVLDLPIQYYNSNEGFYHYSNSDWWLLFFIQVLPTVILSDTEMYVLKEADVLTLEQISAIPHEPLKSELKVGLVCHANYDGTW